MANPVGPQGIAAFGCWPPGSVLTAALLLGYPCFFVQGSVHSAWRSMSMGMKWDQILFILVPHIISVFIPRCAVVSNA